MAGTRSNLAVTKDGGSYNKLKRPDDYLTPTPPATTASDRKRGRDGALDGRQAGNKRSKKEHGAQKAANEKEQSRGGGQVAECGMRETLPLGDDEFDDEDMRPDEDALAYLLGVRSEASAIPRLLGGVEDGYDNSDEGVVCQDGAWIAIDQHYDDMSDDIGEPSPQDEYNKKLIKRFLALRKTLVDMQKDNSGKPQSFARPPRSRHDWYCTIEREFPTPARVLQMDERAILKGLEYCAHSITRFDTISPEKSCWIWTLLASLGEHGTLDHWKMAQVRDIGCRAGQHGRQLRIDAEFRSNAAFEESDVESDLYSARYEAEEWKDYEEEEEEEDGEVTEIDTPAQLPSKLEQTKATQNGGLSEVPGGTQAQVASKGAADDSEAEMSMSEDEKQDGSDDEAVDLEKARARLLAQLGDRLVQPGIHATEQSKESQLDDEHPQDDTLEQDKSANRSLPSRVEAERQRQQMREQEQRQEVEKENARSQHDDAEGVPQDDWKHNMTAEAFNTKVTIDMIVTVVAECYGQKDLLKFREMW